MDDGIDNDILVEDVEQEEAPNSAHDTPLDAIDRLVEHFKFPLDIEGASVNVSEIHGEFEAVTSYACQFISLSTTDYRVVWWRLFHAPNHSDWSNLLSLISLYSLLVSNGKLECVFTAQPH